jgi:hypothetical protein
MKEAAREEIYNKYFDRIKDFKIKNPAPRGFEVPMQNEDGSWTPGWWDIRDWYEYYELLSGEGPNYTMKWYSQNDESGVVPVSELPGFKDDASGYYSDGYAWTVFLAPFIDENNRQGYTVSLGHGSGGSLTETGSWSTRYESYYDDSGVFKTIMSLNKATVYDPEELYYVKDDRQAYGYKTVDANKVLTQSDIDSGLYYIRARKKIIGPYNGCADQHTYLYFYEYYIKEGKQVLFYNPRFPTYDSYEDLVFDRIEKEYEEYEK